MEAQLAQAATYARLYTDERGEAHLAGVAVTLSPVDFAPPAPPRFVSQVFAAPRSRCYSGPSRKFRTPRTHARKR